MIECTKYTPINKGTCLGSLSVYVDKWGLDIYGITLHQKNGKRWINFPSRMYEKDGEKKYVPYFRFKDAQVYEKFCEEVKKAVDKKATLDRANDIEFSVTEIPF